MGTQLSGVIQPKSIGLSSSTLRYALPRAKVRGAFCFLINLACKVPDLRIQHELFDLNKQHHSLNDIVFFILFTIALDHSAGSVAVHSWSVPAASPVPFMHCCLQLQEKKPSRRVTHVAAGRSEREAPVSMLQSPVPVDRRSGGEQNFQMTKPLGTDDTSQVKMRPLLLFFPGQGEESSTGFSCSLELWAV